MRGVLLRYLLAPSLATDAHVAIAVRFTTIAVIKSGYA